MHHTLRRAAKLAALVPAFLLLADCRSSSGPAHPLAGRWEGTFVFTSGNPSYPSGRGALRFSVRGSGAFVGTVTVGPGETAEVAGTVDHDGALRGALESFRLEGHLQPNGPNRATGTATQTLNGATVGTVAVELSRE